jgi:hypothetical protein
MVKPQSWLACLALSFLLPSLASAQAVDDATRRAARILGSAGVEAFEAQDYLTASDKLDRAYRTLKAPSLGLWSARAWAKLGKLLEAAERYQEVVRLEITGGERAVQLQAQADAAIELERLSAQVPNLIVKVTGATAENASITIDGVPLATALIGERRPVNPGKHVVRGVAAGKTVEQEVAVALAETKPVELSFGSPANPVGVRSSTTSSASVSSDGPVATSSSARRSWGFALLGVGGAGLVLGGVATALAVGKKSDLDENRNCQNNQCLLSERDSVDSYRAWRTVSSAGLIGGGVLAAAGVGLLLTAPKTPQTALLISPSSVTLSRRF